MGRVLVTAAMELLLPNLHEQLDGALANSCVGVRRVDDGGLEDGGQHVDNGFALNRFLEEHLRHLDCNQVDLDVVVLERADQQLGALLGELLVLQQLLLVHLLAAVLHRSERLLAILPVAMISLLLDDYFVSLEILLSKLLQWLVDVGDLEVHQIQFGLEHL